MGFHELSGHKEQEPAGYALKAKLNIFYADVRRHEKEVGLEHDDCVKTLHRKGEAMRLFMHVGLKKKNVFPVGSQEGKEKRKGPTGFGPALFGLVRERKLAGWAFSTARPGWR